MTDGLNMEKLKIKNWAKFQHYRDRNPPWIKLHYDILSSPDWVMLDDSARVLLVACMLIGSRNAGEVPNDPEYMRRVAYLNKPADFKPLIKCGFLVDTRKQMLADASNMLADARPETETEGETEKESCPIPQRKTRSGLPRKSKNREVKLASDAEWLAKVRETYAGTGVDIDAEIIKAKGWLLGPKGKGRAFTQGYFLNWLNRCDRVMTQKKTPAPPRPGLTPSKIAEIAAHISAGCADIDEVLARSGELGRILEEEGSKQQDIDKMRVMDAVKAVINERKGA